MIMLCQASCLQGNAMTKQELQACKQHISKAHLREASLSLPSLSHLTCVPYLQGDAMTKQELQAFKQHISKALDIGADSSCVYTFLPDDIQEAGESSFSTDYLCMCQTL